MSKTKARTAAELASGVADVRANRATAAVELERLRAARPTMLCGTDEALDAHDRAIAKAGRTVERADAELEDLLPELGKAEAAEDRARREAAYRGGIAAVAEYRRLAEEEYPALARKLATLLARIGEQSRLAHAANNDAPEGRDYLSCNAFRQEPAPPSDEPEYEDKPYWIGPDGSRFQSGPMTVNGKAPAGWSKHVERVRVFKMPTMHRPRNYRESIEASITLPGVMPDDANIWPR